MSGPKRLRVYSVVRPAATSVVAGGPLHDICVAQLSLSLSLSLSFSLCMLGQALHDAGGLENLSLWIWGVVGIAAKESDVMAELPHFLV